MAHPVTVNEVLDGQTVLDLECLDRIYLNGYVPNLQVGGQVVGFLTAHLGNPIPSPAIFEKIGSGFRRSVGRFADDEHVPVVRFAKDDRKIEVMRPYLAAQAATGRSGVAAIGVAQEFAPVFLGVERGGSNGVPWFSFTKADRRVTCYYFYLWDADFGPAFIKVCSYFPYPAKIWLNGHEWAKRQATQAAIGFTELSNGFAATDDPAALQEICDQPGPGTINVFVQRWLARLPLPLIEKDRDAVTGGRPRCGKSRSPAPSCTMHLGMPVVSSKPWWPTTLISAARTTLRSSSTVASVVTLRAPSGPRSTVATTAV